MTKTFNFNSFKTESNLLNKNKNQFLEKFYEVQLHPSTIFYCFPLAVNLSLS